MAGKNQEVRIRQIRSLAHCTQKQRAVMESLGLRRIGRVRTHIDGPAFRGRLRKVAHLVTVEKDDKNAAE